MGKEDTGQSKERLWGGYQLLEQKPGYRGKGRCPRRLNGKNQGGWGGTNKNNLKKMERRRALGRKLREKGDGE